MQLTQPVLRLANISKAFAGPTGPVNVLSGITLDVFVGQRLCVVGASGSGKSSLLEVMGTLARPDTGTVHIEGQDLSTMSERARVHLRRHRIGFVFQNANLIEYLSAGENVALPLRYQRVGARVCRARALQWLANVGLEDKAVTPVSRLSGGERQRIAFARAMVSEPDLILADEPTGSLDHDTGERVLALMIALADQGKALVMVTHNMAHTQRFDRVLTMSRGVLRDASDAPVPAGA